MKPNKPHDPASKAPQAGGKAQNQPGKFTREADRNDVADMHDPIMTELAEPRDGYEPVQVWLIFLFFALIGWGGGYLIYYSGGFKTNVYNEDPNARIAAANAQPTPIDPLVLGKQVFNNCKTCHQADGRGTEGNYPPLDGSPYVNGPPERIIRIVLDGLQGEITVEGKTFNNVMPAWRGQMNDEKIAAVLTYVRQAWGNKAPPVDAAMVKSIREATAKRGRAWTVPELEAVPATEAGNDNP